VKFKTALLFVALAFGLAWAIRGHFGHEHGAAWAGAIAGMALITAANRADWMKRLPVLATLSAIGWGAGGMMSYGIVVGYGRGIEFGNVFYGLTMLGVVGALYGFVGGGLFGLGLEPKRVKSSAWASLFCEMVCGGILVYFLLVVQFGWKMTSPRSEFWAACLGGSLALAWFLARNGYWNALHVAGYAALGAGFGFGFGNFLQTLGTASGVDFSWWNVMEFSLGSFGGLGMAYGVLTRRWSESDSPAGRSNKPAFLFLFLILPAVNIIQAMSRENLATSAARIGIEDTASFADLQIIIAWLLTGFFFTACLFIYNRRSSRSDDSGRHFSTVLFFLYLLHFLALSYIVKLVFVRGQPFQLNLALYWVVIAALLYLWFRNRKSSAQPFATAGHLSGAWWLWIGLAVGILALCALLSISVHDGLPGAHQRF